MSGKSQIDLVLKVELVERYLHGKIGVWVLRYEKRGSAGPGNRRGRRAGTQPARPPEEELRGKIAVSDSSSV